MRSTCRPVAARHHLFAILLLGTLAASGAFTLACYLELDARERLLLAHAENYFDTRAERMRNITHSLRQFSDWRVVRKGTENVSNEFILASARDDAWPLAVLGHARYSPETGGPDASFALVSTLGEEGADALCTTALQRALKAAAGTGTLQASEVCPLRTGMAVQPAFGVLLKAAQQGGDGPAWPGGQGWLYVAAIVRTGALFAPSAAYMSPISRHGPAWFSVAVYAGGTALPSAHIFSYGRTAPQRGWEQMVCGRACEGVKVTRTLAWAGKEWHLVVNGPPFGVADVPAGAFVFLFAGMLGTAGALSFVRGQNERVQQIRALADLRTIELVSLNAILLDDIAARKKTADELSSSQRELRQLAEHNAQVKEEERKRIAREIHDDLGQNLLALRIDLALMGAADPRDITRENINQAIDQIDMTMSSMRLIINELRPAVLDLGLEAAVEWEGAKFQRRTGVTCAVSLPVVPLVLTDQVSSALYRIVQESLTNIMRHAHATHVTVDLWSENGWVFLRLADNGVGMVHDARRKRKSFGLIGIAERIYALGGAFDADSAAGAGVTLTIAVPFAPLDSLGGAPD